MHNQSVANQLAKSRVTRLIFQCWCEEQRSSLILLELKQCFSMTPPRLKQRPSALTLLWQRSLKSGWTVYGSCRETDRKKEMFQFPCNLVLMPVLFFLFLMSIPQELQIGKTDAALNIQASYFSNFSAELYVIVQSSVLLRVDIS